MTRAMDSNLAPGNRRDMAGIKLQHVGWAVSRQVGVITLDRPERKNPLTFDSYAELRVHLVRNDQRAEDSPS